jgi:AAA ATPase domain
MLAGLQAGRSRALVVRGEAGIGKTALLDHVQAQAAGCRIARAGGVESEMELAFAGLHQLCTPMLDSLDRLPSPQRVALATAFGLAAGDPPDLFLVGLAVLGSLSEVAGERPLVCLIDDVQWLDRSSAQVLGFVARRLLAEPVATVFAVRDPDDQADLVGLPQLVVHGLDGSDARALLDSVVPGSLDERVRDRIVAETGGNPLALVELAKGVSLAELEFGFAQPSPLGMADRIEREYLRQLEALPPDTRRLLAVAAVEPIGDVAVLWRAAERLGVGTDAAGPAEAPGLVSLRLRARFRHPLVRSAVRRSHDVGALREARGALAEATDPGGSNVRAWNPTSPVPAWSTASGCDAAIDQPTPASSCARPTSRSSA